MTASSPSTPLLAYYGSVPREYATRTRVYSTRWYILALFSLLGLLGNSLSLLVLSRPRFHDCFHRWVSPTLHFRQPGEGNSNRAKLGPEQGTKQPIPPTFIKN